MEKKFQIRGDPVDKLNQAINVILDLLKGPKSNKITEGWTILQGL